jgi:hypothetical protein
VLVASLRAALKVKQAVGQRRANHASLVAEVFGGAGRVAGAPDQPVLAPSRGGAGARWFRGWMSRIVRGHERKAGGSGSDGA